MKVLSPHRPISGRRAGRDSLAAALVIAALSMGCDTGSHGRDASPAASQRLSQVSVRLDLPSGSAPSVSMLAFRAETSDMPPADVLAAVDPLVAPAPESSCELRDVAGSARALRAQGGAVSLQELGGVSLQITPEEALHPVPRVYPPLAEVVGGVIAEAGPYDLDQVPADFTLTLPVRVDETAAYRLAVPVAPSVADSNDQPLEARTSISLKGDLVLRVSGPPRTFLEIRPFGAPSAIACAVTSGGWVVVPHDLLAKLVASAGRAPVSFEAVWRESRQAPAGSEAPRVSFETRSSAVLELKP
jgi:hypothetical protein